MMINMSGIVLIYTVLSGKKIGNTDILISLDVVSLFTNIPQDLTIG